MIKLEWKKEPLKSFNKKMDNIVQQLPNSVKKGIETALEQTRRLAIQIKPSGKSDEGILVEMMEGTEIKGRVYTDSQRFPYLVYLEFGTGLYADDEGGGSRAKKIPWYVHTSMADLSRYNYQIITMGEEQFYVVWGMHPHPYMRPAAFQSRDSNLEAVQKQIYETLKEIL